MLPYGEEGLWSQKAGSNAVVLKFVCVTSYPGSWRKFRCFGPTSRDLGSVGVEWSPWSSSLTTAQEVPLMMPIRVHSLRATTPIQAGRTHQQRYNGDSWNQMGVGLCNLPKQLLRTVLQGLQVGPGHGRQHRCPAWENTEGRVPQVSCQVHLCVVTSRKPLSCGFAIYKWRVMSSCNATCPEGNSLCIDSSAGHSLQMWVQN